MALKSVIMRMKQSLFCSVLEAFLKVYQFEILSGVRHATYRDARGVAHSYFFSWEHQVKDLS